MLGPAVAAPPTDRGQTYLWRSWVCVVVQSPLHLVASGSVLLGDPGWVHGPPSEADSGACSSDDWDCYPPAQRALLGALQRGAAAVGGCWVVLTGDYHYSDIKVLAPGSSAPYAARYGAAAARAPIYQVMASGLTNSTATPHVGCEDPIRRDHSGLRPGGECAFVGRPAFGVVDVDWRRRRVHLQIRDAMDGTAVLQSLTLDLDTCQQV